MTTGVGGSTAEIELAKLSDMTGGTSPIGLKNIKRVLNKAQALMAEQGLAAIYLDAGSNLRYFTGMQWKNSERMVGAFIFPKARRNSLRRLLKLVRLSSSWKLKAPSTAGKNMNVPMNYRPKS